MGKEKRKREGEKIQTLEVLKPVELITIIGEH